MLNNAATIHTQLCYIAIELEWHKKTGDTELAGLGRARVGASIRLIAQEINEDLAHICAIISALLAAPAINDDGTFLQQHDMHGEPTPAHRSVPWYEFHKVSKMTTRNVFVLEHAQSHNRGLSLGASYGDPRFSGKPTVIGIPARHDSISCAVWAKGKAAPIKWDRDKCRRLEDDTMGKNTAGTFTPGQGYRPCPSYAMRIGAALNGGKGIRLLLESFDMQAPMLLIAAALAVVMTEANQPKDAPPGREIMPMINRRDADQAATAEANVQAAAVATGVDLYGNQRTRCNGPMPSATDRRCPNLGTRTSKYKTKPDIYCGADCQVAGDEVCAETYAAGADKSAFETKQVASLLDNQASASSSSFASHRGVIPPEESSKPGNKSHSKAGHDALYRSRCRGINARTLILTTTVLQSKTIASLITSIGAYALKITAKLGKAVPPLIKWTKARGTHGIRNFDVSPRGTESKPHTRPFSRSSLPLHFSSPAIATSTLSLRPLRSAHPGKE